MKQLLSLPFVFLVLGAFGQNKYNYTQFNKLMEVQGTDYVIAAMYDRGKMDIVHNSYLLFIHTKTGESHQVDFPNQGYYQEIEQVKIDELEINCLIVEAHSVDLDGKKGISWDDPNQIIVLSTDGKVKTQLTDSKLFVRTWVVNKKSGTIVITGTMTRMATANTTFPTNTKSASTT